MTQGITGDVYPSGERSYLLINSQSRDIPWIGGEPRQVDILPKILAKGFPTDDYIGYLFVRQIPQDYRSGRIKNTHPEMYYKDYVGAKKQEMFLNTVMNFSKFKNWYRKNQKKEFVLSEIQTLEAAPEVLDNF